MRLTVSPEHAVELAALGKSASVHVALLLVLAVAGWLSTSRLPPVQSTRVRLVGAAPAPVAPAQARRAEVPPAPRREPEPARVVPPPEPVPGVAPPRDEPVAPKPRPAKPKPKPKPRPKPTAPAVATTSMEEPPPPATAPATEAGAAPGLAATIDGGAEGLPDFYLDEIVRKVSARWLKPASGLAPSEAIVYFEISRGGAISAPRLEQPSGSPSFDRSALRAVELAAPFGRIPMSRTSPILKVHFVFPP